MLFFTETKPAQLCSLTGKIPLMALHRKIAEAPVRLSGVNILSSGLFSCSDRYCLNTPAIQPSDRGGV